MIGGNAGLVIVGVAPHIVPEALRGFHILSQLHNGGGEVIDIQRACAENFFHGLALELVGVGCLDHLSAKLHQLCAGLVIAANCLSAFVISVVKAQGDVLNLLGPHLDPDLLVPAVNAVIGHLAHQVLNGPDVLPTGHLLLRGQLFLAHGVTSIRDSMFAGKFHLLNISN